MPNRPIAFAHVSFLLLSALITTLLLATAEMTLPTTQHSAVVWIVGDDGSSDNRQIARTVERVAEERDISVGFAFSDVRSPESLKHMYLAVGDPDSEHAGWLENGYPSFGHTVDLRVHPMADFDEVVSPRGFYLVFGPPENERILTEALAEHGLTPSTGATTAELWRFLRDGPLLHVLAVALLVGVTAVGSGVLLGVKDYGVQRLQGRSYGRILLSDLARIARLWALALPVAVAATLVFLGFYNGWNQLDLFARIALAFLGAFTTVALAVHAAVLGVVRTTALLPALNGRLPVRSTMVSAYLVRLPVLVLVLTILGSTVHLAQTAREQRAALDTFERTGDTSRIAMSGSIGFEEMDAAASPVGSWLRRVNRQGEAILAYQESPERIVPRGGASPDVDVLVVNDTYLTEREVRSPTGERYGPAASDDRIRVLLPQTHASLREGIAQRLPEWARFQARDESITPDIEILPMETGQSVFTYGSRPSGPSTRRPFLRDPVIVALPNGAPIADRSYVEYMTGSALVFPDPDVVQREREDPRMAEYINLVQPIRDEAARAYATALTQLRVEVFNLLAATVVLLLTAIATCAVHVRARAQTIFARHISGWGFLATHRRFLALEVAVALGFIGWFTWDTLTTLRAMRDPAIPLTPEAVPTSGLEPLYAAGIAAVGLALTLGTLAVFHRRIVREGAGQA